MNTGGKTFGMIVGLAVAAYTRSFWKGLAAGTATDYVAKKMGYSGVIPTDLDSTVNTLSALCASYADR